MKDKVSFLIVTWNCQLIIGKLLKNLIELKNNTEIIVVDNDSTDGTGEIVKKISEVKLIQNKENLGFGKANNIGVKASKGDYLFFLNPDCEIEKNSVEKLTNFLDQNENVAVVGPKLLNSNGSIQKEMSPFPTVFSETFVLLRLHKFPLLRNLVYPNYDYTKTQEAKHLMGAALMIRRSVFEQVGGFDENFFLWFEETDLLKRIKQNGYKIFYYPKVSVKHLIGQSTRQLNFLKKQTIWNKSLLYYFKKHKNFGTILLLLPFVLLSYPASLIAYLVKR